MKFSFKQNDTDIKIPNCFNPDNVIEEKDTDYGSAKKMNEYLTRLGYIFIFSERTKLHYTFNPESGIWIKDKLELYQYLQACDSLDVEYKESYKFREN